MEIFTTEFLSALMAIIAIDLILAGDNALVIGLAARRVPAEMQSRVIFWGTFGAIAVRVVLTLVVVWLLKIPGFLLGGGLILMWIAVKLASEGGAKEHEIPSHTTVRSAIGTIVVADAVMGVDNVLAVAGAAHGSFVLVAIGLAISIPIVIWGSRLVIKAVERFPSIIAIGAGVLGWTAAKMITTEGFMKNWLHGHEHMGHVLIYGTCIALAMLPALWRRLDLRGRELAASLLFMFVWLTVFDWIESYMGWEEGPEHQDWRWYFEITDLLMWFGWIPFVMLISKKLRSRAGAAAQS